MYNSFIDSKNKEPWILPQNQNQNFICPVGTKMDKMSNSFYKLFQGLLLLSPPTNVLKRQCLLRLTT